MHPPYPSGYLSWGTLDHRMPERDAVCPVCAHLFSPRTRNQRVYSAEDCRREWQARPCAAVAAKTESTARNQMSLSICSECGGARQVRAGAWQCSVCDALPATSTRRIAHGIGAWTTEDEIAFIDDVLLRPSTFAYLPSAYWPGAPRQVRVARLLNAYQLRVRWDGIDRDAVFARLEKEIE